ncbi:MAG: CHAT domain-containing protein [Trichodesmium sp. MAG_R04]|nr:CHAT domain-containing protein [Trichodesmium sp. MAG_R04]
MICVSPVNIGNTHKNYQKLADAFNSYQEAINIFEDLLYQLGADDDAKRKLREQWVNLYKLIVVVCLQLGKEKPEYYATAWEYVERSKTRRLVEIFAQTKPANVSDTDWKEFQDLRNQITNKEKWIEDKERSIILLEELEESVEQPELDNYKIALVNLKQQLNKKLETNPQLAIGQQIQYTPFSKLGEKLSDDSTVVIQWYILSVDVGSKLCVFIYNLQSSQPYVWESSSEDLKKLYQWNQEYLLTYYSNYKTLVDELPERLNRLAEILHIDELITYIPKNCQEIILIPHLFLHLLPIHALPIKSETWQKFNPNSARTNQTHYFFECFTKRVRYAPSFQILGQRKNQKYPNYNHLFAVQNPTLDLKYTDIEVAAIKEFFDDSYILKKENANKKNLNASQISLAHCVHFSCHGSFNFSEPLKSALILANTQIAEVQEIKNTRYISLREGDSFDLQKCLTLEEIFSLNLTQCYLVTLSACETGLIDSSSTTDEYIGLPSSFLYAGASNVVSSLWPVNDLSTTFLMIKLYENLNQQLKEKNEMNVAIALGNAQLWLKKVDKTELEKWLANIPLIDPNHEAELEDWLRDLKPNIKPFESPYYWAAFCAIGQ